MTTVLRAARWADVDAGEVHSPALVVVDGDRIQAVNPVELPADSTDIDLGDVIGLNRQLDTIVSDNATDLLLRTHPDVVIHATTSLFHQVYSQILDCVAARANVKTVVLSHYIPRADGNYMPWVVEVKKHFAGQVRLDYDWYLAHKSEIDAQWKAYTSAR